MLPSPETLHDIRLRGGPGAFAAATRQRVNLVGRAILLGSSGQCIISFFTLNFRSLLFISLLDPDGFFFLGTRLNFGRCSFWSVLKRRTFTLSDFVKYSRDKSIKDKVLELFTSLWIEILPTAVSIWKSPFGSRPLFFLRRLDRDLKYWTWPVLNCLWRSLWL